MSDRATLKSFRIPREDVTTSGGKFSVRGASVSDLTEVFLEHREEMAAVYERVMFGKVSVDAETAVIQMLQTAPNVFAALAARSLDEPDEWRTVLAMPIADQFAIGEAVVRLTFKSGGGLKKVWEAVLASLQTVENLQTSGAT